MFGLNGIGTPEAPHSAIAKSVQRLNVKVIASHGEIAMPTISAHTYKLSIQLPESWLIPSAPRMSARAMVVTWSLNSDVIAAMRTPPRPNKGLISTKSPDSLQKVGIRNDLEVLVELPKTLMIKGKLITPLKALALPVGTSAPEYRLSIQHRYCKTLFSRLF